MKQVSFQQFLLQPLNSQPVPIINQTAILTQDCHNYPVQFTGVIPTLAAFNQHLHGVFASTEEPDHVLSIFLTSSSNSPFFITFSQFFTKFFLYDVRLGYVSDAQISQFPANQHRLFARLKPKTKKLVRHSVVLLSDPRDVCGLGIDLKNVFQAAEPSSFFSQINHINCYFEYNNNNIPLLIRSAERFFSLQNFVFFAPKKEFLAKKVEIFRSEIGLRRPFLAVLGRARQLRILAIYVNSVRVLALKIAPFGALWGPEFAASAPVQNCRKRLLSAALKMQILPNLSKNELKNSNSKYDFHSQNYKSFLVKYYAVSGKLAPQILRSLLPLYEVKSSPPFPVYLNVYHLIKSKIPSILGVGIFHSGLQVCDLEIAFGGHNYPNETGVYVQKPRREFNGVKFYKNLFLGHTVFNIQQLYAIFARKTQQWKGDEYQLLQYNCHDFTNQLSLELCGVQIPEFVNRAAKIGGFFVKGKENQEGNREWGDIVGWKDVK
ncbi:PPPDE putative peptidase domain-containing protein [Spironucleus salmonicida]|uniref:PPPDE putative peptidase domain-containing protein n=1 Tax=Spironucleus salmonicida TaxID=348837 RepID=V6LEJ9_9EUKA|nr:PPPDE putative peptidase domain-containing protein [Spironucleus salmonicida]|eukprot:EST42912.1 PPPDE putative peptidase domain-containing protein [Spironucleus salmonicida]